MDVKLPSAVKRHSEPQKDIKTEHIVEEGEDVPHEGDCANHYHTERDTLLVGDEILVRGEGT